jgi:hypothetical protein
MKTGLLSLSLLCFTLSLFPQESAKDKNSNRLNKINTNDHYSYISINQIKMWVSNNGDGSHDPVTDGSGFYWPKLNNSYRLSAIFEDGLVYGCKVDTQIRVNGNTHRQGLQAGKILSDGTADNPSLSKYRIYKIRKGWEDLDPGPEKEQYKKDYNEWPVEDGAPWVDVNGDGIFTRGVDEPQFIGDEVLWYVANDLDTSRSLYTYGSLPVGLEFQTTVWGYNSFGPVGDMIFKKYKIINKSNDILRDMYLSYWSDPDLGNASDDYAGCDTIYNMGYTYNGDNYDDGAYGAAPPAMGYSIVQGPVTPSIGDSAFFNNQWINNYKNLPLSTFINIIKSFINDPEQAVYAGTLEFYNMMQGKNTSGIPITDPNTGEVVVIMNSGDPVTGTGWYEGAGWPGGPAPDDRRLLMTAGPFNMNPGDTQEIVYAFVIGRGSNNILSVNEIRDKAGIAKYILQTNKAVTLPPAPILHGVSGDENISLRWEKNAESFSAADPLLQDTIRIHFASQLILIPVEKKTYEFEGYRLWQYSDAEGSNPVLINVFDKENGISSITHYFYDYLEPLISGPDQGLLYSIQLQEDFIRKTNLKNGNPYYFGITSYAYSKYSETPAIESKPNVIEIIPGRNGIDVEIPYSSGDYIAALQQIGDSDADIKVKVVDPDQLTGHQYSIVFSDSGSDLTYSLIDQTINDTLIHNSNDFSSDSLSKNIIDGFVLYVLNTGADSILTGSSGIRSILEVKGPGGVDVTPVNVVTGMNSTGKWKLVPPAAPNTDIKQNINWTRSIGTDDYEIRFTTTEEGSEYYVTDWSANAGPLRDNVKGFGKVPIQIFVQPRKTENFDRMMIKVKDHDLRDTAWSRVGQNYEPIYAYTVPGGYIEPIPPASGTSTNSQHRFGNLGIQGELPEPGTVVRIETWKPLMEGDVFTFTALAPERSAAIGKENLDKLSVFPNPYYGMSNIERGREQKFIRFTGLPQEAVVRIFSISGVFIKRYEKDSPSEWLDWDLRNQHNLFVGSGIYLAYIDLPGIGTRVLKIAVIMESH